MCNLHANMMPIDAMRSLFDIAPERTHLGNLEPLSAIYPKYQAPIVLAGTDGQNELWLSHWGFLTPKKSKKTGKVTEHCKPQFQKYVADDFSRLKA